MMGNVEHKVWHEITEPLSAVQNLINGCLLGQSKGSYSFEESSLIWESIKYLVTLQVQIRENDEDPNDFLMKELAKTEKNENVENIEHDIKEKETA
jgi:hypothetical protein